MHIIKEFRFPLPPVFRSHLPFSPPTIFCTSESPLVSAVSIEINVRKRPVRSGLGSKAASLGWLGWLAGPDCGLYSGFQVLSSWTAYICRLSSDNMWLDKISRWNTKSYGFIKEEREPCGTVKCNSSCATTVQRLWVIDCDIVQIIIGMKESKFITDNCLRIWHSEVACIHFLTQDIALWAWLLISLLSCWCKWYTTLRLDI